MDSASRRGNKIVTDIDTEEGRAQLTRDILELEPGMFYYTEHSTGNLCGPFDTADEALANKLLRTERTYTFNARI